jgi:integrase
MVKDLGMVVERDTNKSDAPNAETAELIRSINNRLKAGYMGVSVMKRNNRLYVRSSLFPPKPGSDKEKPHRQEVSLGAYANPAGLKYAEEQAKLIAGQLATRTFEWEPWLNSPPPSETVAYWISELKVEVLSGAAEITWRKDYESVLCKLPQDEPLKAWMLRKAIAEHPPNSKGRKRSAMACGRLAKLAGLEDANFSKLAGSYGVKLTAPRNLPDDQQILEWFERIPEYRDDRTPRGRDRWAFGMLAVYGIRPHELFSFDHEAFLSDPSWLVILPNTKTGARVQCGFMPEWVERFRLTDIPVYGSDGKDNATKGQNISRWFNAHGVPFHPYDLRHAWAVRCIHLGIDDTTAAKMMGHSTAVHQKTYQHWITSRDLKQVVQRAIAARDALLNA